VSRRAVYLFLRRVCRPSLLQPSFPLAFALQVLAQARRSDCVRYQRRCSPRLELSTCVYCLTMCGCGANRTNRAGLMMSVVQGRSEVAGKGSNRRFSPICDISRTLMACRILAAPEIKLGGRTIRIGFSDRPINSRWVLSGTEARFVNVIALIDKLGSRWNFWTRKRASTCRRYRRMRPGMPPWSDNRSHELFERHS
jgi:hypothetical protein